MEHRFETRFVGLHSLCFTHHIAFLSLHFWPKEGRALGINNHYASGPHSVPSSPSTLHPGPSCPSLLLSHKSVSLPVPAVILYTAQMAPHVVQTRARTSLSFDTQTSWKKLDLISFQNLFLAPSQNLLPECHSSQALHGTWPSL